MKDKRYSQMSKKVLKAGVPISKIEVFRDVFEDHGYIVACRRTMTDNIPFIN